MARMIPTWSKTCHMIVWTQGTEHPIYTNTNKQSHCCQAMVFQTCLKSWSKVSSLSLISTKHSRGHQEVIEIELLIPRTWLPFYELSSSLYLNKTQLRSPTRNRIDNRVLIQSKNYVIGFNYELFSPSFMGKKKNFFEHFRGKNSPFCPIFLHISL